MPHEERRPGREARAAETQTLDESDDSARRSVQQSRPAQARAFRRSAPIVAALRALERACEADDADAVRAAYARLATLDFDLGMHVESIDMPAWRRGSVLVRAIDGLQGHALTDPEIAEILGVTQELLDAFGSAGLALLDFDERTEARIAFFDPAWRELSERGECDELGSAEYSRVRAEWAAVYARVRDAWEVEERRCDELDDTAAFIRSRADRSRASRADQGPVERDSDGGAP